MCKGGYRFQAEQFATYIINTYPTDIDFRTVRTFVFSCAFNNLEQNMDFRVASTAASIAVGAKNRNSGRSARGLFSVRGIILNPKW